jgi:signal peptidase II
MTDLPTRATVEPAYRYPGVVARFVLICVVLLAGDLALKWWAFEHWLDEPVDVVAAVEGHAAIPGHSQILLPKLLALKLTLNRGAVFGIGQGQAWLFIVVTIVAVGLIGYIFASSGRRQWLMHLTMALVLAGALGNLYDRIRFAAVRDMLWMFPDVHLPGGLAWPGGLTDLYPWIFNLADVYLVIGIGLLMVRWLIPTTRRPPRPVDAPPPPRGATRTTSRDL